MSDIFIYDAVRTPRGKGRAPRDGKAGGALSGVPPYELVSILTDALETRNPGMSEHIARLSLGCVGQVGVQGGHLAFISRLVSGLPDNVSVQTLNNYCVSGLSAVNESTAWAKAGTDELLLAGGVESLSHVGFLADKASYYTDPSMIKRLKWAPPIMGAELIATLEGLSKPDIDEITLLSHQRADQAWADGKYASSVVPIHDGDGEILLAKDELIRGQMDMDMLASYAPAFADQGAMGFDAMMLAEYPQLDEISHIHSIANCPGMADGAALVLLGSEVAGKQSGLAPKAKIRAFAETAGDPVLQFGAGVVAMETVLAHAGLELSDIDRIEFMEAFAAVPLKFYRDYKPDMARVNVNGGHLAMGHPMGATGAILLTTLTHELIDSGGQLGLVVAHAGGGLGSAMIIEAV